jgi:hypothetical protein
MGDIVTFPTLAQTTAGIIDPAVSGPRVRIADKEESGIYAPGRVSTDDLYPLRDALSDVIAKAFALLAEGRQRTERAAAALQEGDRIASDDEINRLQALLPELFCCRSIGDGFAAIIAAIHYGIKNMVGAPLNEQQLLAVGRLLRRVETEPFVNTDEVVNEIIFLEDTGLTVEPIAFAELSELSHH